MNEQEAIKEFKRLLDVPDELLVKLKAVTTDEQRKSLARVKNAEIMAIKALEKQVAKKPFQPFGTHSYKCSNCYKFIAQEVDDNCDLESVMAGWCPYCGQKLDWSDEE